MKIFRDYQFLPSEDRGASVAIGNFDGVHLGHRVVLDAAKEVAKATSKPWGVLTFEPHPREVFQPDAPPFRLMSSEARQHQLEKLGANSLFEIGFTRALAGLTAQEFAQDVLSDGLGLSHVTVGADFCFGKGRLGTAQTLNDLGKEFGFDVTIAPLMKLPTGAVSSTAIRNALSEGRPKDAAKMLGHWHRIDGPVIQGDQRGRDLGFPTANMSIEGLHPPKFGVYAVLVDVLDGPNKGTYHGAASVGVRPTFGVNAPNIETFLFDFQGDLYGASLSVALVEFLRPELAYEGIDPLIVQMNKDCDQARQILDALP